MKFRVSKKDLITLGIFCLLLLYLCAVLVGNFMQVQEDGSFAGLNPFIGLFRYPAPTFVLFVAFLVTIFLGVKSNIFERKKGGFGLEIKDKEERGYNRWAKEKEYKDDRDVEVVDPLAHELNAAGIPLINNGKKLWVDNGEYHNLVIGSTGSGKSQTVVEPMVELLIKHGESMIITDPKAELYIAAGDYLRQRGYKVVILNFRDPQKGNAWNPLQLPYQYYKEGNRDKATELLDDVALNILYDPNNKGEPFWEKSAADYFSGLALGLFEDAKGNEMNINSINAMSTAGEEKFGGGSTYVKEYFTMKGENSSAYVFASNTVNAPQDTKGSILSVFRQKIRSFASRENLSEMLAYSDFDIRDIGKEKTAVFICIHDEKTTYHGLATIFIKQVYETLIDVAQANGGKLPYRTNFILDEFANMPPLKDVGTMVTAARSRSIRFTFIIQNFAQLKGVYGAEIAETIKGNCGNLVYLISTELQALEEISKMCGEVKSKDDAKTASTPLVTVTDLQKLKLFEAIIIRWRLSPLKVKYTPNFEMNWGHEKSNSAFPKREIKPIEYFDIKTFVKEKKKENMLKSLENGDNKSNNMNNSPFGSPFGNSPFGSPSPFASDSPFASSPFGGGGMFDDDPLAGLGGGNIDYEAMMRDIDKKIAELDAEEARQKEEEAKKREKEANSIKSEITVEEDEIPKINDKFLDISDKLDEKIDKIDNLSNKLDEKIEKIDSVVEDKTDMINANINDKLQRLDTKIDTTLDNTLDKIDTKVNNFEDSIRDIKDDAIKDAKIVEEPEVLEVLDTNPVTVNNSVSINTPNIPVATKSPVDDEDFNTQELPSVMNADVIKPVYNDVKEIVSDTQDIKDRIQNNLDRMKESNTLELDNKETKANVNIDVDSVVTPTNPISDDEFFDDFFNDE